MAKVPEPVLQRTGSQRVLLRLTVVVSIVSLACLVFWFFGVFHRTSSPPDSTPTIFSGSLETVRVERRQFPLIVEQEGSVSMNASVTVSSRIKGRVREVPVNEGSSVVGSASGRGGATILAHLDEDEIRIALRQAQTRITDAVRAEELARAKLVATRSQLDAAKTKKEQLDAEYRRVKDAEKRNTASIRQVDYARSQRDAADTRLQALRADMKTAQKEIERAEMQRVRAESTVAEKRRMLSYATVRAPVSGQVSKRLVQAGDDVVPGQPLFVIATSPRPEFFMHFPESIAKGLRAYPKTYLPT